MKRKQRNKKQPVLGLYEQSLFEDLEVIAELDLCDPRNEATARELLDELRSGGFRFDDWTDGCSDCLACLYQTVLNALSLKKQLVHH